MDSHPIPQNVTSFQFKLVGDMTLKQFLYLAVGSGIAYMLFVFFVHDYPFAVWPLIIISGLSGVSFAFLPIQSRPLDHWLTAFLKAIYSPTKREWKKDKRTFKEYPLFHSRLVMYLSGMSQPAVSPAILPIIPAPVAPIQQKEEAPPLPTKEELQKTVDLARQAQNLQMKIIQTERILSQIKSESQKPMPVPIDYTQQVNDMLSDLQNLIHQASSIKQQIQAVQQPETKSQPPAPLPQRQKVKMVVSAKPKQTTIALTTFPNVVNGIVRDKDTNYLEGVVAVIYDKEGLPVRALKTNKLGQFTGSTPLPNAVYTLELEKEGFAFDLLQIELTGQVLPPLLITAK